MDRSINIKSLNITFLIAVQIKIVSHLNEKDMTQNYDLLTRKVSQPEISDFDGTYRK